MPGRPKPKRAPRPKLLHSEAAADAPQPPSMR